MGVHEVGVHAVGVHAGCVHAGCVCFGGVRAAVGLPVAHIVTGWAYMVTGRPHMVTGLVPLWLQAVGAVCVRLSEGLARSGCVAPGVTLLCDAGCTSWGFDRLQAQRLQPYV